MNLYDKATLIITPGAKKDSTIYSIKPSNVTGSLTFSRSGTAYRVNGNGLVEAVATNTPRIDYSVTGSGPSILLEPQRTNLIKYSEQFNNSIWNKVGVSVSPNAAIAPDGTLTADKLVEDTTNGYHYTSHSVPSQSAILTYSVYAKKAERDFLFVNGFATIPNEFSYVPSAYFNLNSGSLGTVSNCTASIQSVGDGWYRCIVQCTSTFTQSSATVSFYNYPAKTNANIYLGDGTSGIYIWGSQLEVGTYPTSYIPTTSTTVTRNVDSFTRNNIYTNGLITSAGGTWVIWLKNNIVYTRDSSVVGIALSTANGGFGTDAFAISCPGTGRLRIGKFISGGYSQLYLTTTDIAKIAIKWNGSTADIYVNGTKQVNATAFTATVMEYISQINTIDVPKYIDFMALYATPLTDAECAALTT